MVLRRTQIHLMASNNKLRKDKEETYVIYFTIILFVVFF